MLIYVKIFRPCPQDTLRLDLGHCSRLRAQKEVKTLAVSGMNLVIYIVSEGF